MSVTGTEFTEVNLHGDDRDYGSLHPNSKERSQNIESSKTSIRYLINRGFYFARTIIISQASVIFSLRCLCKFCMFKQFN